MGGSPDPSNTYTPLQNYINSRNMSGLLNKAKDALGKGGSSGGGSSGGAGGQQSGAEKFASGQAHTQIDTLTDKAGMGDKYDDKINKFADGQINNQIPGGAGKPSAPK